MKSYSLFVIGQIGQFVTESESALLATYACLTPVYRNRHTAENADDKNKEFK